MERTGTIRTTGAEGVEETPFLEGAGRVNAVGVDSSGELYLANFEGQV